MFCRVVKFCTIRTGRKNRTCWQVFAKKVGRFGRRLFEFGSSAVGSQTLLLRPDCQLPTVELQTKNSWSVNPAIAALFVAVDEWALHHGLAGMAIPCFWCIYFGEEIGLPLVAGVQHTDVVAGVRVEGVGHVVERVLVGHQVERFGAFGSLVCKGEQQRLLSGPKVHRRVGSYQPEGDVILSRIFLWRRHVGVLLPSPAERLEAAKLRAGWRDHRHLPRADNEVVGWRYAGVRRGEDAPSEAVLQPLELELDL